MPKVRVNRVKDYDRPYRVEYFGSSCNWEWDGEFSTKAEATAYIQSRCDEGWDPLDFRIIVALSFTVKVDQP